MPSTTKQVAEQKQADLLTAWQELQKAPQSNERAGLLASVRKSADAIAKDSGVASMLPSTSSAGGGKLATMLERIAAEREAAEAEATEATESTDSE
jgi:hypothetical protein